MAVPLEERTVALAARQHGVITRGQLIDLGMSAAAIGRRLKSGRFRPLHGGVYLVGPLEADCAADMAAVLAGGPAAVLSHTSALRLWGLVRVDRPHPVHVTVPGNGRSRRPGIAFHRVRDLADDERTAIKGVPVTTPARTIVDAAGMLGRREVELALATAERKGLIGSDELAALPNRYSHRRGMAILRALLREQAGPHFTRSEAERKCLDLLRAGGLPTPHANVAIGPYELDLLWPEEGVAIEIDGWKHHSSRPRFEGDRRKDTWLRGRGIDVIRLSWRQITRQGTATVVQVGQTLALARMRRVLAADRSRTPAPSPTVGPDARRDKERRRSG